MNNPNTPNSHHATSPELLPCPFCGKHGVGPSFICESGRWDFWQVECGFCDYAIETPTGFAGDAAKDAAVERWNTRQPQSPSYAGVTDAIASELVKALAFYGDVRNYHSNMMRDAPVARDGGNRARTVLAMRAADTSDGEVGHEKHVTAQDIANRWLTPQSRAIAYQAARAALSVAGNGDGLVVAHLRQAIEDAKELGSGSDFNQGVVRGLEIAMAQIENRHHLSISNSTSDGVQPHEVEE